MRLRRRAHRVQVPGFRFAGVRAGLKTRGPDVALIAADGPAVVAGVFTTNRVVAAPVLVARPRVARGRVQAVLVHAGNANACTGREGVRTAELSTALVGTLLGVAPTDVIPCATGKIGVPVPRARLLAGVRSAAAALSAHGFSRAARAVMTTDAFPKTAVRRVRIGGRTVTIAALAKGAGMIAPRMATLLVFVVTDAGLGAGAARRALGTAVTDTLNAISVDGDMSTNDTVLLLARPARGERARRAHPRFAAALREVLAEIARLVVLDGEGSTRVIEVVVRGARSNADAQRAVRAIATSTLCKAAFHGSDPNWGRFVCAAGTSGAAIDSGRADVIIGGVRVSRRGRPIPAALPRARARMRRREVEVVLDLHLGRGRARMLTSDLTTAYVHFNAAYTT